MSLSNVTSVCVEAGGNFDASKWLMSHFFPSGAGWAGARDKENPTKRAQSKTAVFITSFGTVADSIDTRRDVKHRRANACPAHPAQSFVSSR
jgi:hypothetical protein